MSAGATYSQTATEGVVVGRPAAEAIAEEAETQGAAHVFVMASRTLNRETDEIAKIAKALSRRV